MRSRLLIGDGKKAEKKYDECVLYDAQETKKKRKKKNKNRKKNLTLRPNGSRSDTETAEIRTNLRKDRRKDTTIRKLFRV